MDSWTCWGATRKTVNRNIDRSTAADTSWGPALAALLLASCLVVPLVFTIAQYDVFALAKFTALRIIAGLGAVVLGARWMRRTERLALVASAADAAVLVFVALNLLACLLSRDPLQSLFGEDLQYQGFLRFKLHITRGP